jgi:hypothetical protein
MKKTEALFLFFKITTVLIVRQKFPQYFEGYLKIFAVFKNSNLFIWDRGFESHRGHGCLSYTVFVLSGRGLCDGPIPRPEESYRLWCVFECDQMKTKTLYTCCEQVGRRGKDYDIPDITY